MANPKSNKDKLKIKLLQQKEWEKKKKQIKTAKAPKKGKKNKTWAEMSPLERIKERKRKTDEALKSLNT